jgi:hypothetical protein
VAKVISAGFGVYAGTDALKDGPVRGLPVPTFLRELTKGAVLR